MSIMAWVVHSILGIIWLVCFILVVVKMFQSGQTALGVITIITMFCGVGFLIAFIYGWVKARDWNIRPVMLTWTVVIILDIALSFVLPIPFLIQR